MSVQRFTRADARTLGVVLLLGVVGLGVALTYYRAAFPEASIDFAVSRPEIEQIAREYLEERGFDLSPYRQLVLFRYDDSAKTYLERELDLEEANRLMSTEINVWRWKVRFYRPPNKEELLVWLDPTGELVGFQHIIEEAAPGARLDTDDAQSVAEVFLFTNLGLDLADYTLVEEAAVERPERLDHDFTWERNGFQAKDATVRIDVTVQGDEVGKVLPFLKVPEQWSRDYRRIRSRNETLQTLAILAYVPLLLAIFFVLLPQIRQRRITWKPLLLFGGAVGALSAISVLNSLPLIAENFPTATPYWDFLMGTSIIALIQGTLLGAFVSLLAAGGISVYREIAPGKVSVSRLFTFEGMRTKEFFTSTLAGYCLAALQLGFVVVFYLVARRFGAWSPMDVQYSDFLSTKLPWIVPLTAALIATTTEEFAFRLFAVSFLKKYLKSTWLAVTIPAVIWAFLHAGYPQQPPWIRGVELTLVGMLLGYVMLRFGILTSLVAHYTYNAVLMSLPLLKSDNFYYLLTGGLVMDLALIPLAIAAVFYFQHRRRFADSTGLSNAARVKATPTAPPAEVEIAYAALSAGWIGLAVGAGLLGLLLWWTLPVETIGSHVRLETGRREAEALADQHVQSLGASPGEWSRATRLAIPFDEDEAEYIRREAGIAQVNELWSTRLWMGTANWEIDYFRPLQKESYTVLVSPDGRVRHYHALEETAPGARLETPEAEVIAAQYAKRTYGWDLSGWKLVEEGKEERENRTDYTLHWEEPEPIVAEAHVRARVFLRGDEPDGLWAYVKVPDEWLREHQRPRIQQILGVAGVIGLILVVIVLGARLLPRHRFRTRTYIGLGLLVMGVCVLAYVNGLPSLGTTYDTSVSWATFVFQNAGVQAILALVLGFVAVLVALYVDVLFVSRSSLASFLPPRDRPALPYYRDAVVVGVAGVLVLGGLEQLVNWARQVFPVAETGADPTFAPDLAGYLPGLTSGINAALGGLLIVGLVGIIGGVFGRYIRSSIARLALLAVVLLLLSIPAGIGPGQIFYLWVNGALGVGFVLLAIRPLYRGNLLAYLITFTGSILTVSLMSYSAHGFPWAILVAVLVAAGLLAVVLRLLSRGIAHAPST